MQKRGGWIRALGLNLGTCMEEGVVTAWLLSYANQEPYFFNLIIWDNAMSLNRDQRDL